MKYVFLIYNNDAYRQQMTEEQLQEEERDYGAVTGEILGGNAANSMEVLMPVQTATTVRVRDGKTVTTDGPFAETREQLGGLYVVECENLDEAIALAARIPGAQHGSVEIRPAVVYDEA